MLAAETPVLPGSPDLLYIKALVWFFPHISGKCWAYLARATKGVQTDNPINSGFIFGRNEAWGMVSAVKATRTVWIQLLSSSSNPSPFTQGIQVTDARKEAVVATSGSKEGGKGSCDQPNN